MKISDCLTYLLDYLKVNKAKDIISDVDFIEFRVKDTIFFIQIEDEHNVQYSILSIDDINLPEWYYDSLIEYGDLRYIEEYFFSVVIERELITQIKNIYKTFNKMIEKYDETALQIGNIFFGN